LFQDSDQQIWPPLIDALSVTPGYEAALGAALGDDLQAVGRHRRAAALA
jgi:chromosome segregation protein